MILSRTRFWVAASLVCSVVIIAAFIHFQGIRATTEVRARCARVLPHSGQDKDGRNVPIKKMYVTASKNARKRAANAWERTHLWRRDARGTPPKVSP